MATDFLRTNLDDRWSFVRGAARLLVAADGAAFPTKINDVLQVASGTGQYDAASAWTDLGATLTGITVSVNHAEETFTVDQVLGDIDSQPTSWEASVSTQLAENTLEHFQLAWEGSAIATNTAPSPDERTLGYGQPTTYVRRKLAVAYKNKFDLIRIIVFRRVQLQPVESTISFNKTGEQIAIPVQFKALADPNVSDVTTRFFTIFEQLATG